MIDWSKAPGATVYADGDFWSQDREMPSRAYFYSFELIGCIDAERYSSIDNLKEFGDFEINPDAVLLPYQTSKDKSHGDIEIKTDNITKAHKKMNEIVSKDKECVSRESISVQYLNRCKAVQAERGKQYDSEGAGERSFDAAAQAFNALTGEKLNGSDVCLLLTCLKVVRQNSDKSRIHDDSLLDGISYLSLWAEELTNELK